MGSEIGRLITCDRCGNTIFLKVIDSHAEWDETPRTIYEPMPDTWLYETPIGYLCDRCAEDFRYWITEFMNGKVAPVWNYHKYKEKYNGDF